MNLLMKLNVGSLLVIVAMSSCLPLREIETATIDLQTATLAKTAIPTTTFIPTSPADATTIVETTQWAIRFPTSTTPPGYPTPLPPPTQQFFAKDIAVQNNPPQIVGGYILRSWVRLPFNTSVVTISRIDEKQVEIKDAYVWIDKATGIDLTGDGFPEAVIRTDEGGNGAGAICSYISIISLADEPTLILDQETTCGYRPNNDFPEIVDFFVDFNNDGKTEYISFLPSKGEDGYHFDFGIEFMKVWEYNVETNSFELASSTELSYLEYAEKITELESLNR